MPGGIKLLLKCIFGIHKRSNHGWGGGVESRCTDCGTRLQPLTWGSPEKSIQTCSTNSMMFPDPIGIGGSQNEGAGGRKDVAKTFLCLLDHCNFLYLDPSCQKPTEWSLWNCPSYTAMFKMGFPQFGVLGYLSQQNVWTQPEKASLIPVEFSEASNCRQEETHSTSVH